MTDNKWQIDVIGQAKKANKMLSKNYTEACSRMDKPMSVDEILQEMSGDLPRWAIALRGLRAREGLTQIQMSALLDIPQGNISQMEHGKRPIGKQIAKKLAGLFKTDYRLFL